MTVIILIAIAAGCASALMFASIVSGALISLLLLYLVPLPLMVAALGWGPLSAIFGGIGAAIGLGALFGLHYAMAFVVMAALPAWWLGHLVLLGRPATNALPSSGSTAATPALEWYPVGRILLWISVFAALTTMAALLTLGGDADAIRNTLHESLLRVLSTGTDASADEIEQWADALISIAPASAAVVAVLTLTINLWLAARITAMSGRLHRPWPDLKSTVLPTMTLAAFLAAIGFCFTGGLLATFAKVVATTLTMAYALAGFAVLHTLTLAWKSRLLWLSCTYAIAVLLPWILLAIAALGLADTVFGFRMRYLSGKPPPLPAS